MSDQTAPPASFPPILGQAERWEIGKAYPSTGTVVYQLRCLRKLDGRRQWVTLMESAHYGVSDHAGRVLEDLMGQLMRGLV